ncbi:glycosyltransferase family 2 protein [Rhodobacter sp. SGA-6-6]|uniref:glycosyltransferase family 2 protein n=1 Tax=Rhodobacter sp. SGA-6-6 TaxID=2710882 RepID=UPI0013EAA879|nr:glycosyltransferase family 2 protein [Rhodobacter sp. SGA-6-6]NGM46200.1 glycosyltransferase family 2 protein [Rhodobacter sp. SGA-6-6]
MPASPSPGPSAPPLISVILPCLDEEEVLGETLARLDRMAADQPGCRFEFVFVDDGSRDGTAAILRAAAARDPRVRLLRFARNFGQQIAVSAGIEVARGDAVVLMDADLQDPPEVVGEMVALWRQGFDVVYGTRSARPADGMVKRGTARLFYAVINRLSEVPIPSDTGDFRLMSRPVVEVLRRMPERHRFIRGMVSWAGFRQTALHYERPERFAGRTKYPLRKMLAFAADGILSFSIRPLQLSIALGLVAAGLALLGIGYALFMRIFTSIWVEGWTALMLAVLFMGGVQLLCLGILGEYVGRIYSEVKRRPLYVVAERAGFDEGEG